jgi:hypothetical protein
MPRSKLLGYRQIGIILFYISTIYPHPGGRNPLAVAILFTGSGHSPVFGLVNYTEAIGQSFRRPLQ